MPSRCSQTQDCTTPPALGSKPTPDKVPKSSEQLSPCGVYELLQHFTKRKTFFKCKQYVELTLLCTLLLLSSETVEQNTD